MTKKTIGAIAGQIGGLTAISRIFGFVRDIVFAIFLGAGPAADAFFVAFKLPNVFRRLSAEGALTNAFLPQFANESAKNGRKAALFLAAEVQIFLTLVLAILVIVAEIFMPAIIEVLAPGFVATPDRMKAAINLARITMPYLPLISLVALFVAIANAHDRFAFGAAMPIILNIALIIGACFVPILAESDSVMRAVPIAIAVVIAGVLQLFAMHRFLKKIDVVPPLIWPRVSGAGRRMWRKFMPAAFGAAGMQLNTLVDLILASLLPVGAISWLYFADRVAQLPLGIVGIAIGTALLPRLSQAEANADHKIIPTTLAEAITLGAFFILPAVAALIILDEVIITGLFGYGAFGDGDAKATAAALSMYAIGLPAFVLIKILQTAFYASGRPTTVLIISLIMVALNIVGSIMLMKLLGHVGLALATSLAALVASLLMIILLVRDKKLDNSVVKPLGKQLVATLAMLASLHVALSFVSFDLAAVNLAVLVVTGSGVYLTIAFVLGILPKGVFNR